MNIFETATRKKLRFPSNKGELTAEQLWDLPLTSLDTIARQINQDLKAVSEEGFINVKPDPRKPDLETKLEVLKHIIAVRLKAVEDAKSASARSEKRRKLAEALANKEEQDLAQLSKEEILKQLEELDTEG
ncbi:hypothetical protein JYP52_01205 [Nitratireductor aquibiodomus]|uniref:hypothetical protein n=1 Tax=Nitratireductor aquibiodomus TaxID=204799 RepID=UPI0019D37B53|nr:hypothetical protein [Nitratireductor aquibiodomus]MBN7759739.1 hypothetical protein [Nitratireductor aquibiodomus]